MDDKFDNQLSTAIKHSFFSLASLYRLL